MDSCRVPTNVALRFWGRVNKDHVCWVWAGGKSDKGYGRLRYQKHWVKAHRFAWLLSHGYVPADPIHVLHRCDNRLCVRPSHLFLGTDADNVADCIAKGRHARAKLKTVDVLAIRQRRQEGFTQRAVGAVFGVDRTTVRAIERREIWKHVP